MAYESEDQSTTGTIRAGMRVRHRQFGVGTIVAVEDQGDDVKVTVRFPAVGTKKLLVKYAGLEPAKARSSGVSGGASVDRVAKSAILCRTSSLVSFGTPDSRMSPQR